MVMAQAGIPVLLGQLQYGSYTADLRIIVPNLVYQIALRPDIFFLKKNSREASTSIKSCDFRVFSQSCDVLISLLYN